MHRRKFLLHMFMGGTLLPPGLAASLSIKKTQGSPGESTYDVVIVGGTPAGIMAAVAVSRMGKRAVLLERTHHIGGLPANGLGATDISTRGATEGLFMEFITRVREHYVKAYGEGSPQVNDCSDGYHFEPAVAEKVFNQMIDEEKNITVLLNHQFDPLKDNVDIVNESIRSIRVLNRENSAHETFNGAVFIDATYEGDLIAAAGIPYLIGREGFDEYKEPYAGRVYKYWNGPKAEGSTLLADNAIQSFNYRLCLTNDPANRMVIRKPARYNHNEFTSLIEDVTTGRHTGHDITRLTEEQIQKNRERISRGLPPEVPGMPEGIWRLTNMVKIPNGKTDANNQHLAFISTDLPEENWPWPSSGWDWRDRYAQRLREYTLGLLWFAQNDPELPEWFKEETRKWGLAGDEYMDNDNFPRQVYVREGRRMQGKHFFTAHDALPETPEGRPPIHASSITASHYAIDSHAVRKREPGRVHLDGFLSYKTRPYTVPYGVMVPEKIKNLLAPVPVSGTHLGFSTLRMEPCWMAMGQAAGVASVISIETRNTVQDINPGTLQEKLLGQGAVLIYFEDAGPEDPDYALVQFMGLKGILTSWRADLDKMVEPSNAEAWAEKAGLSTMPHFLPGKTSNRDFLKAIYQQIK